MCFQVLDGAFFFCHLVLEIFFRSTHVLVGKESVLPREARFTFAKSTVVLLKKIMLPRQIQFCFLWKHRFASQKIKFVLPREAQPCFSGKMANTICASKKSEKPQLCFRAPFFLPLFGIHYFSRTDFFQFSFFWILFLRYSYFFWFLIFSRVFFMG